MATITLKNIPDKLYERLKYFAKIRHRSVNSEIINSLERSFGLIDEDHEGIRKQAEEFRARIGKKGTMPTSEEVDEARRMGRP
jgi:hypothetical protein